MEWEDIIKDKSLKKKIDQKIDEIADSLESSYDKVNTLGLLYGKGGIVLFFCYYNLYKNSERFNEKIATFIEDFEKSLKKSNAFDLSYSRGLSGILWLINFLRTDFIEADDIDNQLVNIIINKTSKKITEEKDLDFMHGAFGSIFFLNEVKKDPKILKLISAVQKISKENSKVFIPFPSLNLQDGKTVHNLGLAHGLPSFIIILCNIFEKYRSEKIKIILEKAVTFLLSHKNPNNKKFKSIFPSYVFINKKTISSSRLGWCYGDIGIALAIYRVSLLLGSELLYQEAMNIFLFNAKRRKIDDTFLSDAEFCHGSSGIAHIYNRLYHETKNQEYKKAAAYWYKKTISFATKSKTCAGYRTTQRYGKTEEYNFLEGIAGIGLTLISSVSNIKPKWDRSLLIT